MFKRYVCSVALLAVLTQVTSCSKSAQIESGSIVNPDVISGVAATGAPISGGKVKIKGSDSADPVETETEADGSYSIDIASLREPYLVQVESPSGEKLISVASQSALAEGKKINVTPISHLIVSKVFGKADADDLFENFEEDSKNFSDEKLEEKKNVIFKVFKDAGLIGSSGVVGESVDLLNGNLLAGTSQGLDGLLDVLQVNTGAAGGIDVKLKTGTPVVVINPASTVVPEVAKLPASVINESKAQLTVLDQIRAVMTSFTNLHSTYNKCNGAPKDDGGACDVDTIASKFLEFFHPSFQEDGYSRSQSVWDWFCANDNDDWILSRNACLAAEIDIPIIVLKDVNLINYNATTKEALIGINVYVDGRLEGSEDFYLKMDGDKFKLFGNKKTFRYWIDTESVFKSDYVASQTPALVNDYSVIVSMWYDNQGAHSFDGDEVFTMTALSGNTIFPNGGTGSATKNLYLVKAPVHDENGQCSMGLAFSTTNKPYKVMDNAGNTSFATYTEACGTADACMGCNSQSGQDTPDDFTDDVYTWSYYDWESHKLVMTEDLVMKMNKTERISLTSTSGVSGVTDEFIIRKPLVINQFNASTIVPTFGKTVAQLCSSLSFTSPLNLAVSSGRLSDVSFYLSYHDGSYNWQNVTAREELHQQSVSTLNWQPDFGVSPTGVQIPFAHLYLSSRDDLDRRFVRQVSCQM